MKIATPDGIVISAIVEGSGPPLMLISGSGDDHTRYGRVAPILAQSYTLYCIDRRGRGESTDAAAYSFRGEVTDMLAVVEAIHEQAGPVHMLAHSYGALVGLETAQASDKLKSVLLYEPPMPFYERIDGTDPRKPIVLKMVDLLAAGDVDGMLAHYLEHFLGSSPEAIARQKSNPKAWARWLSVARTIPRELLFVRDYEFDPVRFAHLTMPFGIMVGGKSRSGMRRSADRIRDGIPQTQIIDLPGEGHSAMTSSPEMFASAALAFFNGAN